MLLAPRDAYAVRSVLELQDHVAASEHEYVLPGAASNSVVIGSTSPPRNAAQAQIRTPRP